MRRARGGSPVAGRPSRRRRLRTRWCALLHKLSSPALDKFKCNLDVSMCIQIVKMKFIFQVLNPGWTCPALDGKRHRVLDRRRRSERGSSHLKRCTVHLSFIDLGVTPCALPLKWMAMLFHAVSNATSSAASAGAANSDTHGWISGSLAFGRFQTSPFHRFLTPHRSTRLKLSHLSS